MKRGVQINSLLRLADILNTVIRNGEYRMITLTVEERIKFALWLRQDADCNKGLVDQLRGQGTHFDPIVATKKLDIAAALIMANILDDTGEFTIDNKGQ